MASVVVPTEEFASVKREMEAFSQAFAGFVIERKNAISTSKQQHKIKQKELEKRIKRLHDDIRQTGIQEERTRHAINESMNDLISKQAKVDGLSEQLSSRKEARRKLEQEISELVKEVEEMNTGVQNIRVALREQVSKDSEELVKFEMYLGMKIEAVDIDLLRFKFVNILPTDVDREVWCELNLSEDEYKIGLTFPELPHETILRIERDLNGHGEIILFLKAMRNALRQ